MFITLNPLTLANSSFTHLFVIHPGVMRVFRPIERKIDYINLATNKSLGKSFQQMMVMDIMWEKEGEEVSTLLIN